MHFAPDTESSLDFAVALVNTSASASLSGNDELASVADLNALVHLHRYSGRFDDDLAELQDVQATRLLIESLWVLPRDDLAEAVNKMLAAANALPRLVRHDEFDWHLHATSFNAPLAERIRAEVGLALLDVVRTNEVHRMRVCEAHDCTGILLDLSRNGSKRFCSVRCSNRMNTIAFRERKALS